MISVNELRVGNWVSIYDYFNGSYSSMQIHPSHIKYVWDGDCKCEPIPLTPEILEKSGIVKIEALRFCKGNFSIKMNYKTLYYETDSYRVILLYVHQLQNLYFALTGEETTIKF